MDDAYDCGMCGEPRCDECGSCPDCDGCWCDEDETDDVIELGRE